MQKLDEILSLKERRIYLNRTSDSALAAIAAQAVAKGRNAILLATDRERFRSLLSLATLFSPRTSAAGADPQIPIWDREVIGFSSSEDLITKNNWANYIAGFYALSLGKPKCVICDIPTLLYKFMPLTYYDAHVLDLQLGNEFSPDLILEQAVEWGYERTGMVVKPGEIARRGDILDIYPVGYTRPARLEFFGDAIDEMRLFDQDTQRSLVNINALKILPFSPLPAMGPELENARKRIAKLKDEGKLSEDDAYIINKSLDEHKSGLLPGLIWNRASLFEDWIMPESLWILPGENDCTEAMALTRSKIKEKIEDTENLLPQPSSIVLRKKTSPVPWNKYQCLIAEPLVVGIEAKGIDLNEHVIHKYEELFPAMEAKDRPWQTIVGALKKWQREKNQVILSFSSERGRKKFLNLAEKENIVPFLRYAPEQKGLYALIAPFAKGIDISWNNSIILGEDILYPRSEKVQARPRKTFKGLDRYDDLTPGDLIVHRDYGIGRYAGLHHLEVNNVANDYLLLEYSGNDKLYIPVDRLKLVQRFKGGDGAPPALDRLGSTAWAQGKEKAKKAIEKIAHDLVDMYAYRKVAKGFHYDPPGDLYREFEATFNYEETPDQDRAILDVLEDMEKNVPMDRLVCGDVGFGKTEVALRAAFRAASEGRQVALLCPTTVLAEQHYQTFRSRLSGFPVNVGLLSRFVPKAKQKEILKGCETGQIDILIGTHRLLSNDVKLPNLALLILDEEQRFGVRHKEKLKEIKKNVDVLTLTATPIPRTLQLSMSGIRDLSIIETPPQDRKPVASAILERDEAMLGKIIAREMERGGQVFWVYNRVQGLERVAEYVRKLAPSSRIGVAHGQMSEKELETTMHKFWHGELDVLVCTSIVESGLDFPQANTLIVDQAQMFGLGQLYQLRGRVGRSDRQAYAYFVVPDAKKITDIAEERLRIILDMDYLGAGFQVAMEDLRLRGAGNILGEVQTGHMSRVGIDLYLEMLEEAVAKLKGAPHEAIVDTEMTLGLAAHLPDTYIEDGKDRMRFYKMLTSAQDETAREEISLAMRDQYGPIPIEAQNFIDILNFKQYLSKLQVEKAEVSPTMVKLFWTQGQTAVSPEKIILLTNKNANVKMLPPSGLLMQLSQKDSFTSSLEQIKNMLETTIEQ